jgi:hypothetical protein
MYQMYLLSILTIVLASASLGFERFDERLNLGRFLSGDVLLRGTFRFGLGLVTFVIGFFRLLFVTGESIPILGDLLPAAAGIVLGGTLILTYYNEKSSEETRFPVLDRLFVQNASNFAILGFLIALLHFLLPAALFL